MYEGMESKVLGTELRIRIRVRRVNCNETMLTEDVPFLFSSWYEIRFVRYMILKRGMKSKFLFVFWWSIIWNETF